MRVRRFILRASINGILFWLTAPQMRAADDPGKAIADLRQVATDLDNAVKLFETHLDREMALNDGGYRTKGGQRIPGADAEFISGPADVVQRAMRRLFAARMISARGPGYAPAPMTDFDHIQALILEARARLTVGNAIMRRFMLVSAKDLNPATYAEQKVRQVELLKARNTAVEAAQKAFVALPVPLPDADSLEEQRELAWDLMVAKMPVEQKQKTGTTSERQQDPVPLPVRFEPGKRITLVNEHFCRVALTDSGLEDSQGRHLFYQEEWVTRPGSLARTTGTGSAGIVVSLRRAVAVNTKTGQHTLLRRYDTREFQGDFDNLYQFQESDYISSAELTERPAPPSMQELKSAAALAERSRKELSDAVTDFRQQIRDSLTRNDASLSAQNKLALDDELPNDLRENLFAIRGHVAGAPTILDPENRVRTAVARASARVRELEAMAAWVSGEALMQDGPASDSRALAEAESRSDALVHSIRSLERDALTALPPDLPLPEAQLPALRKDLIVRLRRLGGSAAAGETAKYKQDIWRPEGPAGGARQVKRTIIFIDIDAKSGSQTTTGREVKYYPFDACETLEEIYDQNAAQ
jgi:hypothetical protein